MLFFFFLLNCSDLGSVFGWRLSNSEALTAVTEASGIVCSEGSFRAALRKAVGDTALLPPGAIAVFSHGIIRFLRPVVDSGILPTHISSGFCWSWDDSRSAHTGQPVAIYQPKPTLSSFLIFYFENTIMGV